MEIKIHTIDDRKIAEIISDDIVLQTVEDAVDLIGNMSYQGFDKLIIHEENMIPDFFELKNKIAGNILQKFSQYSMPLAIIGDFEKYESKSLNDFIFESNKGKQINFVTTIEDGLK
jgi:alpha/beta hydrolase